VRDSALLIGGGNAAWRIARAVSGRLRAHPYENYQRDAGFGVLLANGAIAAAASLSAGDHRRMLGKFSLRLKETLRELEYVRAFTWAADMSDTLGRSQTELRAVIRAVQAAAEMNGDTSSTLLAARPTAVQPAGDWPFLAI